MGIVINDIPYVQKDQFGTYDNIDIIVERINDYLAIFDVCIGVSKEYVDTQDSLRTPYNYVDSSLSQRDNSLNYLYNNYTTKTYVDGSLSQRDSSLNVIFNKVPNSSNGSILFFNNNIITSDNSTFFWDTNNKRLGIETNSPNSTIEINGSISTPPILISSDTSLGESHRVVIVPNQVNITLPNATGISGREYNIIRSGLGNVTLIPVLSQTISGDASLSLTSQWDSVVIISDNSNWVRCS